MGKFSDNLGKAADNAERLASALQSLPTQVTDSAGGGGSGAGGGQTAVDVASGFRAPTQAVFNTTVNLEGSSGGSSGGGGERLSGTASPSGFSKEFIAFLRTLGIYNPEKRGPQSIAYLMREFEKMLKKNKANALMAIRTEGLS